MENRKIMRHPFQPFTFQTGMPNFFPLNALIWIVCVDRDFFFLPTSEKALIKDIICLCADHDVPTNL